MATLFVYRGESLIERIPIGENNVRIGRLPDNDVVLPDDGKAVSRFHAELRLENGAYVIHDLNSQNGTWVEASRVSRAILAPGQEVVIGPYRLTVGLEELGELDESDLPTGATLVEPLIPPGARSTEASYGITAPTPAVTVDPGRTPPPGSATRTPVQAGGTQAAPARAKIPDPQQWIAANRNAVMYGGAALATLVLVLLATSMLRDTPVQETPLLSPTTTVPAPPAPEEQHYQAAMASFDRGEYQSALVDLEQLLASNPEHEPGGLLWNRAQVALAPPPPPPTPPPSPTPKGRPIEIVEGIALLQGESQADYTNRVEQVRSQYEFGDRMLGQEEWITASQIFERLQTGYPDFRDVRAKAQMAREKLDEARRAATASGRRLEQSGDFVGAVKEYTRAGTLGADVDGDIARANAQARTTAGGLMKRAKMAENYQRDEAIKMYRQIVALLPAGDPDREYAEGRLRSLAP